MRFPVLCMGIGLAVSIVLATEGAAQTAQRTSCSDLVTLSLAGTTILSARVIPAGTFEAPESAITGLAPDYSTLPAFCRVMGSIRPSAASDIRFEVWLPAEGWNGHFMQTGNGGAVGAILHASMAGPISRGYAVANSDTGHQSGPGDFSWAVGHPEKLKDYQYRAVHALTRVGKAITESHFGEAPDRSYWMGCSAGGRQGLKEAQMFPGDYDGIIAGAPANNWSPLLSLSVMIENNIGPDGLGVDKLGLLKEAAIAACDENDGVKDRVISDPSDCDFDPSRLRCMSGGSSPCLNETEIAAAQRLYAGLVNGDGDVLMPGTGPGSEPAWAGYASPQFRIGTSYYRSVVFNDPEWDPATFDVDADLARAEAVDAGAAAAMDPDLSDFLAGGGKLIMFHGTTDGLIPYGSSVTYYESVVDRLGVDAVEEGIRFYLVPGMDHCAGGEGATVIDWLTPLEQWVEDGTPPGPLRASRSADLRGRPGVPESGPFTRPVCPYPQLPRYSGSGDSAEAASFDCAAGR